jgi:transposase
MSVIFRRVTNGFRSEWGRDLFAAVRSVVNTGKRQGLTAYQSIQQALSTDGSLFSPRASVQYQELTKQTGNDM